MYGRADVAQSVEHLIGNEEVRRFKSARQLQLGAVPGTPGTDNMYNNVILQEEKTNGKSKIRKN